MLKYKNEILKIIDEVFETQTENMEKASDMLVEAVEKKNSIYIFGSSHAGILSEEAFYRAGGFALINPTFSPNLMLNVKPVTFTSELEQLEGYGRIFFQSQKLKKDDVLIIHSVSGRNPVSIEMAEEAKKIWSLMEIEYDDFIRTTDERHTKVVEEIFDRLMEQGDIYK